MLQSMFTRWCNTTWCTKEKETGIKKQKKKEKLWGSVRKWAPMVLHAVYSAKQHLRLDDGLTLRMFGLSDVLADGDVVSGGEAIGEGGAGGLGDEGEGVAKIRFGLVGDVEALETMTLEQLAGEEVEDVLNVFDAVDVAVDVHVAVMRVDGTHSRLRSGSARTILGNRTGLLVGRDDITENVAVFEFQEVRGLARREVNHRPNGAGIAVDATVVGVADEEVTLCEQLHDALHPRLHLHVLVLRWHLCQLDAQARQHPRVLHFVQLINAPAAIVRMASGSVQQVVAQHAQKQVAREIHMEGLNSKGVYGDLPHARDSLLALPVRERAIC